MSHCFRRTGAVMLLSWALCPSPSLAAEPPPAFAAPSVDDAGLAAVRGGYLGRGYVASLADAQARDDFRQTSSLGTLTFDNWFNDVGSALIINALLSAPR